MSKRPIEKHLDPENVGEVLGFIEAPMNEDILSGAGSLKPFIYLTIKEFADEDKYCSAIMIKEKTGLGKTSVLRHLRNLVDDGKIIYKYAKVKHGKNVIITPMYTIESRKDLLEEKKKVKKNNN